MKKKFKLLLGAGTLIAIAVAYYALSPLWRTVELQEQAPDRAKTIVESRQIIETPAHPASGTVSILETSGELVLRYENFKTINGPDLRVYLSADLDAREFIDLGEIKATEGNVNYSIPSGTDISKYHYALVWCEDFGVLFNSADLRP